MAFCNSCGAQLTEGTKFCSKCGAPIAGASAQKQGASTATFGKVRTVSAAFESDDAVEKVCAFYKSKFPNATVSTSDQNRCTIVSNDPPNMITINVEPSGDGSKFQIASVSSKSK